MTSIWAFSADMIVFDKNNVGNLGLNKFRMYGCMKACHSRILGWRAVALYGLQAQQQLNLLASSS